MPVYEYACADCGKTFESFQKISEEPVGVCPLCGGARVQRLISSTAFHLKGSGWYKTDYGSSGASTATSHPEASTSTASAKPGSASDGTPARSEPAPTAASATAADSPPKPAKTSSSNGSE